MGTTRRSDKGVKTTPKKPKPIAYGFWEYDVFPYCVGGELTGPVEGCPGWWHWSTTGHNVRPFIVMSVNDGRKLHERLENLSRSYEVELTELKLEHMRGLLVVMPEVPELNDKITYTEERLKV